MVGVERHDVGSAGTERRIERRSLGQQACAKNTEDSRSKVGTLVALNLR
jgi:hypothetical protein